MGTGRVGLVLLAGLAVGCGGGAPQAGPEETPAGVGQAAAPAALAPPPDGWAQEGQPPNAMQGGMPAAMPDAMQAAAPTPPTGPQRVAIIDPNGFEQPMPAQWVQLPAGWQTRGGVVWDQNAPCGATPSLRWQARSGDGSHLLTVHPAEAWTWDNLGLPPSQGACPRQPITNVRQYLEGWVQRHRPGARVLDYRPRPDLVRRPPPPSGNGGHWRNEAGELLLAHAGENGEMRESVSATVLFSEMSMPGVMPGEVRQFITGAAGGTTTLAAPAGQLQLDLLGRISASIEADPQWQARMDRHNSRIASDGLRGQVERGRIRAETNREIADMNMRGWEERNAANDRMHARTIDGITETTRYQDPAAGGQVRLEGFGDNAWRTNDGTYLQSDDPNFDPQRDLDVEAERLERIE